MLSNAEIRRRLSALSPRERIMAAGGAVAVLAYAVYLLLWQPLQDQRAQLRQSLQAAAETHQYLQQMAGRIAALGAVAAPVAEVEPAQLPQILKQSAGQMQLEPAIRQMAAQTPKQFEIVVEKAAFDPLLQWLAVLADKHGARVSQLQLIAVEGREGAVDGRLTLVF